MIANSLVHIELIVREEFSDVMIRLDTGHSYYQEVYSTLVNYSSFLVSGLKQTRKLTSQLDSNGHFHVISMSLTDRRRTDR